MERLTGTIYKKGYCNSKNGCELLDCEQCQHFETMIDRLAYYEELEEQGLLLKLPCKVGDTIYKICPQSKHIQFGDKWDGKVVEHLCQRCPWQGCGCKNIGFQKDMDNIVRETTARTELWILERKEYFGEIYFLTKEEAEKKLAEMKGGAE